jgi:two-component system, sensor histidine kinase and response regulator
MTLRLLKSLRSFRLIPAAMLLFFVGTTSPAFSNDTSIPDVEMAGVAIADDDQDQDPVRNREYVNEMNNEAADLLTAGQINEARKKIDEALNIASIIGDDDGKSFAYANLGNYYSSRGLPDSVIVHLSEPFETLTHAARWINIGNIIASAYHSKGEFAEAIRLYLELLEKAEESRNYRMIAAISQNMARSYKSLGETSRAVEYYMSALELAEERQDSLVLAVLYDNLGIINTEAANYELAEEYLYKSLNIAEGLGNLGYTIAASINLGILFKDTGRFEESIEMYQNALEAGERLGNIITPIQVRYNLGVVYNEMGEPEKALEYFRESYDLSMEYGVTVGAFYNYSGMGESFRDLGDLSASADYFRRSLDLAESMSNIDFIRVTNEKLYRVYEMKGDTTAAYRFLQRYSALTDSLSQTEREQALARQEAILGLRLERENRELAERALASQQRTLAITYVLLFVIIVALIGVLLLYRNKRRVNAELKVKQGELEKVNLEKDKLLSILAHDLRSPLSDLQSVVFLLQEGALEKEDLDMVLAKADAKLQQGISILTDYLQWAQNQKDGINPKMKSCKLANAVNDVFHAIESNASNKGITIRNDVSGDIHVLADENMLKVILRNLVSNSVKYVEEGGFVNVHAEINESGEAVCVFVRDNGTGIPDKIGNEIFSSFSGSVMGTHGERGTGLGLSICKDFVELMGGEITFRSLPEGGTEFMFSLQKAVIKEHAGAVS